MAHGFLDLIPDLVASAGRATASTSTQWAAWAGNAGTQLRSAAFSAGDAVVSAAFEEYLSTWNPQLHALAAQIETLGGNTVSGAGTVDAADADSNTLLGQQMSMENATGSWLNRPIEG
jgi:hypothetical protein